MGFLDGLVKNIAEIIPDQGNPELQAYKAQNELKDLAAKEDKVFARLGKQLFADGGAEKYPEINAELNAIAAQRTEIEGKIKTAQSEADAKKKAEQAEEARRCPDCGASNPEGAAFCQSCGAKLNILKRFCPKCGAEVPQGSRFCNECGQKIED
ncbi:MAG: zinc-ribbon domain-containing protein [Dysgonamonadaceae bacterium]|jgi:ribosomal protein L40E|nr:zinc-ribbon domain-containing protein [Dysgonamonadaceae bacterium]